MGPPFLCGPHLVTITVPRDNGGPSAPTCLSRHGGQWKLWQGLRESLQATPAKKYLAFAGKTTLCSAMKPAFSISPRPLQPNDVGRVPQSI